MGRNKKRRRSSSAAVYIPAAAVIILFLVVFSASVFLQILEIEVIGATKYTEEEVIRASGIGAGDNMLFVKRGDVSQRILAAMPYINEVSFEFRLPDKMHISVSEAKAAASIKYKDGVIIIDSAGKVLGHADVSPKGAIEVIGLTPIETGEGSTLKTNAGGEAQLRHLLDILKAIESEEIQDNVTFIDVTSIANISLGYAGRFTVILGSSDNARYKLSNLPGIIADAEQRADSDEEAWTIDLSDRGGRWSWSRSTS